MKPKVFVAEIKERDWVETAFLVRDKVTAMARNGKPYLTLKLMDRSGELEGRVWDRVDEFSARFEKDDFLLVKGKASVYLGKMQLVIQDLELLDEARVELGDFLPCSKQSPQQLEERLRQMVRSLDNPHLRSLLQAILDDPQLLKALCRAPAAKSMHHVYLGGLLEHSLAVVDLVDDVTARYPQLDRDLLVTGALLHDIGKTSELTYARSFDYSDEGKLLGHIMIGVEIIEEKLRSLPEFPRELAVHLKHLLLSHHGQYEYGSPKRPKTLEAVVLNYLDDLDSKINGINCHIEKEVHAEGAWTSYHRLYDRYFFKGRDMTPAPPAPPVKAPESPAEPAPKPESATRPARSDRRSFGTTLGEQLKAKNLDLSRTASDKDDSC